MINFGAIGRDIKNLAIEVRIVAASTVQAFCAEFYLSFRQLIDRTFDPSELHITTWDAIVMRSLDGEVSEIIHYRRAVCHAAALLPELHPTLAGRSANELTEMAEKIILIHAITNHELLWIDVDRDTSYLLDVFHLTLGIDPPIAAG